MPKASHSQINLLNQYKPINRFFHSLLNQSPSDVLTAKYSLEVWATEELQLAPSNHSFAIGHGEIVVKLVSTGWARVPTPADAVVLKDFRDVRTS